MKVFAIGAVLLLIAALAGVGWLYMNATVTVQAVDVTAVEAASQSGLFRELSEGIREGRTVGTAYTTEAPGEVENYQFLSYTLRITNHTAIPMEGLEVMITPMEGDVAQVGDLTYKTLAAGGEGDLGAVILTGVDQHSVREAVVTWYMWGLPFSQKVTCGR